MKNIKSAEIHFYDYEVRHNEPWNKSLIDIDITLIKVIYADGGWDEFIFCHKDFYFILDDNVDVTYKLLFRTRKDKYFCDLTFKSAVFNRTLINEYQYPKSTRLHLHTV